MAERADKAPTASEVRDALLRRYEGPEWHTEVEFTLEGRRLDVFAMNRWGARGYRTVGFEIKVSRGDWRRELENFRKSDLWTHVVDQFYVVAPGGIVPLDELPDGWGLLELRGSRMFTKRQAAITGSLTLPREIAARMLDRALKAIDTLQWKARAAERALSDEQKRALRAEVEAEVRRDIQNSDLERDALAYRALMHDAGLRGWDKPAEILRTAAVIARAAGYLHKNEAIDSYVRSLKDQMAIAVEKAEELSSGIAALRGAIGPLPLPDALEGVRLSPPAECSG